MYWVKLSRSNDLCELLHVDGLYVDNVYTALDCIIATTELGLTKALVTNIHIPQIDSQVVCGDVCFTI